MDELILPAGEKGAVQQAESLYVNNEHNYKVTEIKQAIKSCAECQCKVSGIDYNSAKAGAYWAAATYKQDEKKVNPPLDYVGETSTGKSQNVRKIRDYSCNPSKIINAKYQTFPTVRDLAIDAILEGATTILIEESDRCKHSMELEEFIYGSYDRITSQGIINRERTGKDQRGFEPVSYNNYAAFAGHRRHNITDAANARRAIVIETHQIADTEFPLANEIDSPDTEKMALVADFGLMSVERPKGVEGSIWNNWEMLIQIATSLGDTEWVNWATERMKEDSELLKDGRSYEPRIVIANSLIGNLEKTADGKHKRVTISQIVETAKKEHGITVSHKLVSGTLKKLKLPWGESNGKVVFHPTDESLGRIAKQLCLPTDFLSEIIQDGKTTPEQQELLMEIESREKDR